MNNLLVYLLKIGLSIGLGLFVGYERDTQHKTAGLRDVALVCLGSTLFTIISLEIAKMMSNYQSLNYDLGRVIAYIIVSIGFLGSGVILKTQDKLSGITTASVLWSVVATGICCGLGLYELAILSALCIYLILKLKYIRIKINSSRKKRRNKRGKKRL